MKKITSISLGVAAGLIGISSSVFASGFQLFEGNAASVMNFGAGGAAIAEDASTSTYNPAGLTRLKETQVALSVIGVNFDTTFTGSSTWSSSVVPHTYPQTGKAKGGKFSPVPAIHIAKPINDRLVAALSVTAPFGLATDYDTDSFIRYAGTKTKLVTMNISPAFGYKFSDAFSVGAGLDVQYADVDFNSVGGIPAVFGTSFDTISENSGHDTSLGWHAGALWSWNKDTTRVGFNYSSQVNHTLLGRSVLTGELANGLLGGQQISEDLRARVKLPSTAALSFYQKANPTWAFMGSVMFTNWSVFKQIRLENVAGIDASDNSASNEVVVTANQNYRDTWRVVAGVDHQCTDKLMMRAGLGYDQSPVNNHDRDIRLPDGDRVAASVGLRYQLTKKVDLDVGYTHLFVKDTNINNTAANGNAVTTGSVPGSNLTGQSVDIVGRSKTSADLVGAQLTVRLG